MAEPTPLLARVAFPAPPGAKFVLLGAKTTEPTGGIRRVQVWWKWTLNREPPVGSVVDVDRHGDGTIIDDPPPDEYVDEVIEAGLRVLADNKPWRAPDCSDEDALRAGLLTSLQAKQVRTAIEDAVFAEAKLIEECRLALDDAAAKATAAHKILENLVFSRLPRCVNRDIVEHAESELRSALEPIDYAGFMLHSVTNGKENGALAEDAIVNMLTDRGWTPAQIGAAIHRYRGSGPEGRPKSEQVVRDARKRSRGFSTRRLAWFRRLMG